MQTLTHRRFVSMFAFVLGVSIVWGILSPDPPPSGPAVLEEIQVALHSSIVDALTSTTPVSAGRIWRPWRLKRVRSIGAPEGLSGPREMKLGPDNSLYVLDRNDGLVKRFDASYNLTTSYGENAGAVLPTTFVLGPDGGVWTSDPNDRITLFKSDGNLAESWPREARGLEMVLLADRLVVFTSPTPDNLKPDGLFTSYMLNGEKIGSFGFLLEEQERNWIAALGRIVSDDDGEHLFYVAQYGGLLARFDSEGELDYVVRTVDSHLQLPTVERLDGGAIRLAARSVLALNVDIDGERVYVLTRLTSSFGVEHVVVDVYSRLDGAYLHTYEAPESCSHILVVGERVYTSGPDGLTEWRQVG